jgi:alanine racemase
MDNSSSSEDTIYSNHHYWANKPALKKKHHDELQELNIRLLFQSHFATNEEDNNKVTNDAPKAIHQLKKQQEKEKKQLRRKPDLKSSK